MGNLKVSLGEALEVEVRGVAAGLRYANWSFFFLLFGEESKEAGINRQCSVLLSALSMFSWCFHSSLARFDWSLLSRTGMLGPFRFLYFPFGLTSNINQSHHIFSSIFDVLSLRSLHVLIYSISN